MTFFEVGLLVLLFFIVWALLRISNGLHEMVRVMKNHTEVSLPTPEYTTHAGARVKIDKDYKQNKSYM